MLELELDHAAAHSQTWMNAASKMVVGRPSSPPSEALVAALDRPPCRVGPGPGGSVLRGGLWLLDDAAVVLLRFGFARRATLTRGVSGWDGISAWLQRAAVLVWMT